MTPAASSAAACQSEENTSPLAPPTPEERLQASRLALQEWIDQTYHRGKPAANQSAVDPDIPLEPGWLSILADSLMDLPAATIAVRWIKRWWRHHPWRATADFASVAGRELTRPLASKHPWLFLSGAAVMGALLVQLKPWRWVSRKTLLAGLLPSVTVTSILHGMTSILAGLHPRSSPETNQSNPE